MTLPSFLPIDRGIPIPPPGRPGWKGRPPHRINWGGMKVGDSVYVPHRTTNDGRVMTDGPRKRHGFRFVVRGFRIGIRIWRVE